MTATIPSEPKIFKYLLPGLSERIASLVLASSLILIGTNELRQSISKYLCAWFLLGYYDVAKSSEGLLCNPDLLHLSERDF